MTPVAAVTRRCVGCGACLLTCPEHAIRPRGAGWTSWPGAIPAADSAAPVRAARPANGPGRLIVLDNRCTGCGECVEVCPVDAIDLAGLPGSTAEET